MPFSATAENVNRIARIGCASRSSRFTFHVSRFTSTATRRVAAGYGSVPV